MVNTAVWQRYGRAGVNLVALLALFGATAASYYPPWQLPEPPDPGWERIGIVTLLILGLALGMWAAITKRIRVGAVVDEQLADKDKQLAAKDKHIEDLTKAYELRLVELREQYRAQVTNEREVAAKWEKIALEQFASISELRESLDLAVKNMALLAKQSKDVH